MRSEQYWIPTRGNTNSGLFLVVHKDRNHADETKQTIRLQGASGGMDVLRLLDLYAQAMRAFLLYEIDGTPDICSSSVNKTADFKWHRKDLASTFASVFGLGLGFWEQHFWRRFSRSTRLASLYLGTGKSVRTPEVGFHFASRF